MAISLQQSSGALMFGSTVGVSGSNGATSGWKKYYRNIRENDACRVTRLVTI